MKRKFFAFILLVALLTQATVVNCETAAENVPAPIVVSTAEEFTAVLENVQGDTLIRLACDLVNEPTEAVPEDYRVGLKSGMLILGAPAKATVTIDACGHAIRPMIAVVAGNFVFRNAELRNAILPVPQADISLLLEESVNLLAPEEIAFDLRMPIEKKRTVSIINRGHVQAKYGLAVENIAGKISFENSGTMQASEAGIFCYQAEVKNSFSFVNTGIICATGKEGIGAFLRLQKSGTAFSLTGGGTLEGANALSLQWGSKGLPVTVEQNLVATGEVGTADDPFGCAVRVLDDGSSFPKLTINGAMSATNYLMYFRNYLPTKKNLHFGAQIAADSPSKTMMSHFMETAPKSFGLAYVENAAPQLQELFAPELGVTYAVSVGSYTSRVMNWDFYTNSDPKAMFFQLLPNGTISQAELPKQSESLTSLISDRYCRPSNARFENADCVSPKLRAYSVGSLALINSQLHLRDIFFNSYNYTGNIVIDERSALKTVYSAYVQLNDSEKLTLKNDGVIACNLSWASKTKDGFTISDAFNLSSVVNGSSFSLTGNGAIQGLVLIDQKTDLEKQYKKSGKIDLDNKMECIQISNICQPTQISLGGKAKFVRLIYNDSSKLKLTVTASGILSFEIFAISNQKVDELTDEQLLKEAKKVMKNINLKKATNAQGTPCEPRIVLRDSRNNAAVIQDGQVTRSSWYNELNQSNSRYGNAQRNQFEETSAWLQLDSNQLSINDAGYLWDAGQYDLASSPFEMDSLELERLYQTIVRQCIEAGYTINKDELCVRFDYIRACANQTNRRECVGFYSPNDSYETVYLEKADANTRKLVHEIHAEEDIFSLNLIESGVEELILTNNGKVGVFDIGPWNETTAITFDGKGTIDQLFIRCNSQLDIHVGCNVNSISIFGGFIIDGHVTLHLSGYQGDIQMVDVSPQNVTIIRD